MLEHEVVDLLLMLVHLLPRLFLRLQRLMDLVLLFLWHLIRLQVFLAVQMAHVCFFCGKILPFG